MVSSQFRSNTIRFAERRSMRDINIKNMTAATFDQHYAMLQRNLLYTGVTRGKRLVVLVGQKKAVAIAVRNVSGGRRWSKLAEWLSADVSKRYVSA
jgi:5-keto 4-deoxyuronate isomerase